MGEFTKSGSQKFRVTAILIVLLMPYLATLVVVQPRPTPARLSLFSCGFQRISSSRLEVTSAPVSVNWNSYHNYTGLVSLLVRLNISCPDLVDVFTIGKTWQGRDIFCIRITDKHVDSSSKQQILIVSEHHAREVITQEAALFFTMYLLTYHQTDVNIQSLLASKEIYVIPCLNPDGMEAALTYNPFQRKNMHPIDDDRDGLVDEDVVKDLNSNGNLECYEFDTNTETESNPEWAISDMAYEGNATRGDGVCPGFISDNPGGVDLNRNYGFHFNDTYDTSSNSTNPRVEDYKGLSPFSEPETRAIKHLVESHRFIFAMSLHSGTEILMREWAYTKDVSSLGANYTLFNMLGETFEQSSGYPYFMGVRNLAYNCSGEFGDWMYGAEKIPTMTCEIYGNYQAYQTRSLSQNGSECIWWGVWDFFNPQPSMIEQVCLKTLRLLLHVSSINCFSSVRTYTGPGSVSLSDGSNTLNLTWSHTGVQDVAIASYAFLPFETRSGSLLPIGNVFSMFSDQPVNGIQITLKYSDQELQAMGTVENDIGILEWDSQRNEWSWIEPTLRDATTNSITVETNAIGNTPYYFMLALHSVNSLPNATAIFLMVIVGITVGLVIATVFRYRGKEKVTPTDEKTPSQALHKTIEVLC